MVNIYILKLEQNKYYIGKSTNPNFRLEQHFNATGSSWTQTYKPLEVISIIPNCDDFDEDKITLQYMAKYGIDNVRGGSFCELHLTTENKNTINKMLSSSQNKCFICSGTDHFAKYCPNKTTTPNKSTTPNKPTTPNKCSRCQRAGHTIQDCYSKTTKDGIYINDSNQNTTLSNTVHFIVNMIAPSTFECRYCKKQFNTQKGATYHENIHCKLKQNNKTDTSCIIC